MRNNLGKFSWNRSILSYTKVHVLINDTLRLANIWRNRRIFINTKRLSKYEYLNVGGGYNKYEKFVNLDYRWYPGIDVTWGIEKIKKYKYPFEDNSFKGIYSEHCLEHISFDACLENLKEFLRILKLGGTLRIIVPDGELYINWYNRHKKGERVNIYRAEELNEATPMISINRIARSGHQFIYDYETMEYMLHKTGFQGTKRESFKTGRDPMLLRDSELRRPESFYVEASKPL